MVKLAKRLNIPNELVNETCEQFELMQARFAAPGSQPMLHPLPLCNNNLRKDAKPEAKDAARINIGKLRQRSKEEDPTGLSVMQRSSVIRTEALSWEGMLKSAFDTASSGGSFAELFRSDTLDGINSDISSMCMGVPFGVSQDIYVASRACSWREGTELDADAVASLKSKGAVPIGYVKHSPFDDRNLAPYAVAERSVPFALSIDLLGSSLADAARAGVIGMRPTYGTCSRMGLVCTAPSMQSLSLHSTDAHSLATVLEYVMHGEHNDCTSYRATLAGWYSYISKVNVSKRKLGLARNLLDMRSSPRATSEVIRSAELLSLMGTNVLDIEAPICNDKLLIRALIAGESRYDDVVRLMRLDPADLPLDKRCDILLKHMLLNDGTTLRNARCLRNLHAQNMERVLSDIDWFICPTVYDDSSPSPALNSLSLAGICGLTLPCGSTAEGNKLGLLLISRQLSEANTLGLCNALESSNHRLKEVPRRGRRSKI
ncbi:MAG: hypothetical protein IKK58_04925 [Clostridia bacterium]|nr:hypothetical protein [Clostridia bacterium]